MMDAGELCISCGYWVATHGQQCEMCHDGLEFVGLEAHVVAAAIVWRRNLIPKTSSSSAPAAAGLVAAVDALLASEDSVSAEAWMTLRPSDSRARRPPASQAPS